MSSEHTPDVTPLDATYQRLESSYSLASNFRYPQQSETSNCFQKSFKKSARNWSAFVFVFSQLFNTSSEHEDPTPESRRIAHLSLGVVLLVWTSLSAIFIFAADDLYAGNWWLLIVVNYSLLFWCAPRISRAWMPSVPSANERPTSTKKQDMKDPCTR